MRCWVLCTLEVSEALCEKIKYPLARLAEMMAIEITNTSAYRVRSDGRQNYCTRKIYR